MVMWFVEGGLEWLRLLLKKSRRHSTNHMIMLNQLICCQLLSRSSSLYHQQMAHPSNHQTATGNKLQRGWRVMEGIGLPVFPFMDG
jgi:hypothetical protein